MSAAFLIIDLQKAFVRRPNVIDNLGNAYEYINETADLFRKANLPVIHVQDESGKDVEPDGFEIADEIVIKETDLRITKVQNNAFFGTNLNQILKERNVEFVVVSGFAAEYCVLFTYNGAEELGYTVSGLQHGIVGNTKDGANWFHSLRATVSIEALYHFLNK